jgi:membrane protein implicated in regulation of membrane protease activity
VAAVDFLPIWAFWLAFALLLFAAEILTAGFFLVPFGLGAAAAAVAAFFDVGLLWQWATFLLFSALFLVTSRRFSRLLDRGPASEAGAGRLIGMTGIVVDPIDPGRNQGSVRVDNESWRAESAEPAPIPAGRRVTVLDIRGARLVVRPREDA